MLISSPFPDGAFDAKLEQEPPEEPSVSRPRPKSNSQGPQILPIGDLEPDDVQNITESFENTQEERDLVRKLDRRILPITCLLYLFASLDRSNIGNARLQGLPEDILGGDKSGQLFDWVISAFFFSYVVFQIPLTILSKLFPPQVYVALAAIGWGTTSSLMATAFNFPSLFIARLVLGVFEAGFGPVITLYFSFFYTKKELGLRFALWFGFATVAGAFGGLIAFGVQHISWNSTAGSATHTWRLLFIIEGIPPVLLGILTYFILPNRPESTTYLTEREREVAVERMNRDSSGDMGRVINRAHVKDAFLDWRIYIGGVIYFGLNCALASIGAFLPTVITTFGYTKAKAQLMTVPPYFVSALVIVAFSLISDRIQSRGLLMSLASLIGAAGYLLLLIVPHDNGVRYFSTFCITSGTYTTIGLTIAWFGHNLGSETKKATGIPIFMAIGQCGSILGSHLFPKTEGPKYIKGFGISCALMFVSAACCLVLSISYRWENTRRDKVYGKPEPNRRVITHELADKAPGFRYVP